MDSLSLESLRAFSVFAEELNFTHAAQRLSVSQPALHTRIQALAKNLGTVLYYRTGRRLLLTPKGSELADFAREVEVRVGDFGRRFREEEEMPVVLGAGQGAYLYLLGPGLRAFREAHPLRKLRLVTADGPTSADWVRSGRVHLGVGGGEAQGIRRLPLGRFEQVLVLPKEHRLARARRVRLQDFQGLELIAPPAPRPQRRALEQLLLGLDWKVSAEATGWDMVLHFLTLGFGAAVVNSFCPIPKGFVARPLEGFPQVEYSLYLPSGYVRSAARDLADFLVAHCPSGCGQARSIQMG